MKILKQIILIIFLSIVSLVVYSQSKKDLESKKKRALEEIEFTNKLIKETKNNQKESYNNLFLIGNKISVRQQLINEINEEVKNVDNRIKDTEFIINIMEEDLKQLSYSYAKMVRAAWKNKNKQNTIMFVLSSEDFNQTYLRLKYMEQLSNYRKRQLVAINSIKEVLAINVEKLNEAKLEKTLLLNEEKREEVNLLSEKQQQEQTLTKLKGQEKDLQKKLKDQEKQMKQLQKEIEKLIAEENKKASSKGATKYELTPTEKIISTNFGNNKGTLPWPVERGVIVSYFGKHNHPELKNIEQDNKGIDISTIEGAFARAIFDGEVKHITSIPGIQTVILIRHGEYISAYTHLETVSVSVGDIVAAKQNIGKIHTDKLENKTILHLEIWKDGAALDPSVWLIK